MVEAHKAGKVLHLEMAKSLPPSGNGERAALQAIIRSHVIAREVLVFQKKDTFKAVNIAWHLLEKIARIDDLHTSMDHFRFSISHVKHGKAEAVTKLIADAREALSRICSDPAFAFVGDLARELSNRATKGPARRRGNPGDPYRHVFLVVLAMKFFRDTGALPPDDATAYAKKRRGNAVFYDIACAALVDIGEDLSRRTAFDAIRKAVKALNDDDDLLSSILAVESVVLRGKSRRSRRKVN